MQGSVDACSGHAVSGQPNMQGIVGAGLPTVPTPTPRIAGSLAKLADLKARGFLTDEEFKTAKAQVLG